MALIGPPRAARSRARVVPLIAARAAEAEQQRKPADDVIEALKAPACSGRSCRSGTAATRSTSSCSSTSGWRISEACPSTGWITTFYMEHNWLLGMFDEQLQHEIFARAAVHPGARHGEPERGGDPARRPLRAVGPVAVRHRHRPRRLDVAVGSHRAGERRRVPRMFLVPVDDVEVKDTWHVDGMAATGSHDIVAQSVRGALRRVSNVAVGASRAGDRYLGRLPVRPFLALTAAIPAIGCARRAVRTVPARMPSACCSARPSARPRRPPPRSGSATGPSGRDGGGGDARGRAAR